MVASSSLTAPITWEVLLPMSFNTMPTTTSPSPSLLVSPRRISPPMSSSPNWCR